MDSLLTWFNEAEEEVYNWRCERHVINMSSSFAKFSEQEREREREREEKSESTCERKGVAFLKEYKKVIKGI